MGTRIRHIVISLWPILVVCIACFALYGCTRDDLCRDGISDGIVQVGFRIRLNDSYGIRAVRTSTDAGLLSFGYNDSAKYGPDTGYENYIGFADRDFRFLLFDGDGKFLEAMTVLGIVSAGDSGYSSEYTVLCSLAKKPEGTFKVMALANWGEGNYPQGENMVEGITTIDDICESNIYAYAPAADSPFTPSAETPIPMYGVKTSNMKLEANRRNDIGDLYLLRAMAKVEVVCREGSGLELASVTLARYNTEGFCAPDGMDANTSYVSEPHIPADAVTDASLDFHISTNKDKAVIYIPEYRNTGIDRRCWLSVTFADNTDKQYTIDFREYSNGKPVGAWFDILRNCCYRFTVDKTAEFEVDMIPYGVIWLDPGFGID